MDFVEVVEFGFGFGGFWGGGGGGGGGGRRCGFVSRGCVLYEIVEVFGF